MRTQSTEEEMGGRQMARVRRRLGLNPVSFRPIALVTSQLVGGKATFMKFAHLAVHIEPALACVAESYDSLNPVLRRAVSIDELCQKHGIDPAHYIAVVGEAALRYEKNSAILIAGMRIPEVVECSINAALEPGGVRDRKMLFQHAGFIPVPPGRTTDASVSVKADASADTERAGLPSFEQTMREVDDIIEDK